MPHYHPDRAGLPVMDPAEYLPLFALRGPADPGPGSDATTWPEGWRAGRDRIIRSNLGLVVRAARLYRNRAGTLQFGDLVGAGTIGLIDAIDSFDPTLGFLISTHAWRKIKRAIKDEIVDGGSTIRVSHGCHPVDSYAVDSVAHHLVEMGRRALRCRATGNLGLDLDPLHAIASRRSDADPTNGLVFDLDALGRAMEQALDDREREAIRLRFGLAGAPTLSLSDTGRALGCSREMARRIEAESLRKLAVAMGEGDKVPSPASYLGVIVRGHRFVARVCLHGRGKDRGEIHVGTFDTPTAAARARDLATIERMGPDVRLNFPDRLPAYLDELAAKAGERRATA